MPIRRIIVALALLPVVAGAPRSRADGVAGLRVPPGFVASEFAGSDLANDIQCLTIDPAGRVIVAGRRYIRVLIDDDGDGRADRALPFADGPADGAMGLLWEGDSLFVVGDGGLRRYVDADGDGRADGPSELILPLKTGGEHDAHAVRRGPDGWLYVMIGNFAGIDASYASLPSSPIAEPVAGALLRLPPDLSGSEVVADGFRNAYDFDFGEDGEIFTYDSDNERCVSLPWYEPTRLYHVVPGGHHGWLAPQRTETWRLPPEVEDVVPPAAAIGRGSPTGVVRYRHDAFPERYRGGLFLLDWTFGRVVFARPERRGASFVAAPEVFIEPTGTEGFAWTDAEVHPRSGDLYLSIGGRGTRGAVYRVSYEGGRAADGGNSGGRAAPAVPADRHPSDATPVPPGAVDPHFPTAALLAACESGDDLQRLRALVALNRRRASVPVDDLLPALVANAGHPDRLVRMACAALIGRLDPEARARLADALTDGRARLTLGFGLATLDPSAALAIAAEALGDPDAPDERALAACRLVQVALGGQSDPRLIRTVWEGYSAPRDRAAVADASALIEAILSGLGDGRAGTPAAPDRERTRTLAMLAADDPRGIVAVASRLGERSDPVDDLHHLIVLGRLPGPRPASVTRRTAHALIALDRKLDARGARRDRNWPLRVSELFEGLARHDPGLPAALLAHDEFGRPGHALFARLEGFDRPGAAARFLDRAEADPDFGWTAEVLAVLAAAPSGRARSAVRRLWGERGLDEAILPILAADPSAEDRPKFVAGLRSSQPSTVAASLEALDRLGPTDDPGERLALIAALRRSPGGPNRSTIAEMLARWTGRSFGDDPHAWASWFAGEFPEHAAAAAGADGVDLDAWARRLAAIDWDAGDPDRGRAAFDRAQCSACHAGGRAVGPDLSGVASRFSRDDLFAAILQPSRDVADRYRSVVVATDDGAIHEGIVIYDAVDSLILQVGPTETIRIDGDAIEQRRPSETSLMPAGLIDGLTDAEIADLDAYLRSLR